LVPWCLGGSLLLSACSRDRPRQAASPTPTLFAATPTAAGITRSAQTSTIGAGTATSRTRAEAFLRRIAPTDADLPPGSTAQPARFDDGAPATSPDVRVLYTRVAAFDWPGGQPAPAGGTVLRVMHIGFAFAQDRDAREALPVLGDAMREAAVGGLGNRVSDPRVERIEDFPGGEAVIAWRASGSAPGSAGPESVRWSVAVRRGPAAFTLEMDGSGAAADVLARDVVRRMDQRLAQALAAGAWP